MNGSLRSNVVDIELKRGSAGLGFNIVGGVDQQYVANDSGIYVSKIKEDGAAALDGRLEEGDKILMINGVKLEAQTHNEVVNLFRKAGEDVELRVLKKSPHHANGPAKSPQSDPTWSDSYVGIMAVLMGAAAILSLVYLGRIRRAI
ncbi:synaptojanin-2-binding protein [Nerophis ophidion]|uniref:synaptojanin-2-binding protein n=1 Tax=Nerophis ophidion TaxID=159077 RepID=UPI002ADFCFC4|nr:synaptojanin-2-binding protein [Nerophis ophidion]XP_061749873.1 synaptojanin-2-binding protein [Nerophis ophidion]